MRLDNQRRLAKSFGVTLMTLRIRNRISGYTVPIEDVGTSSKVHANVYLRPRPLGRGRYVRQTERAKTGEEQSNGVSSGPLRK